MTKIAIVTDSNSGITQKQGKKLGVSVLPMPFMIKDDTYFEDINLSQEEFYQILADDTSIGTSQPSPLDVMQLWNELLDEFDQIVHIPMSSGLSGSCESAMMLAEEYHGKVQVVNNQRIPVTQRQSVMDAIALKIKGYNALQIKELLEEDKTNSSIYIMLDTLYYLKKGGRITPAAAALGTILKIKPVLQIQGEKLDAFAKARTSTQGKSIMINAIKNDIQSRFGGISKDNHIYIQIAHTNNQDAANQLKEELTSIFPDFPIMIDPLSLSVACHIGPGALAIACCKQMDILKS